MRASGKAIGASVGRMIFAGQSSKRIEKHLEKVGHEKLSQALSKRGVSDVKAEDIAKAMSGELRGRAGWTQGKLKNVVEALQEVGVARAEKSASHMILQATKNIEVDKGQAQLSKDQLEKMYKDTSREGAIKTRGGGTEEAQMSVLDRARGAMGRANSASNQGSRLKTDDEGEKLLGVREAREQMRQDMHLQPKMVIPKPNNPFINQTGFQP